MVGTASLSPRQGRDRVDHADAIMRVLENNAYGLTIDECIDQVYQTVYSSVPPSGDALEYEREEFKRSYDLTIRRFEQKEIGSVWIRTRRRPPAEWVYYAAAKVVAGTGGTVVRMLEEAISVEAFQRYYREWETRTRTMTRMQILDIEARRLGALMRGDVASAGAIENELDEIRVISPRLDMLNFGAGIVDQNLAILDNDPRSRLIRKQLGLVRQDLKRLERSTSKLGGVVEALVEPRKII